MSYFNLSYDYIIYYNEKKANNPKINEKKILNYKIELYIIKIILMIKIKNIEKNFQLF